MFSRLDPIFQAALPRQTEGADTRQEIRRQEKEDGDRRKGGRDKDDQPGDPWEDSAVVSVRALSAFLSGLAGSGAEKKPTGQEDVRVSAYGGGAVAQEKPNSASSEAARAAKAYKTMYYTGQKEHQLPLPAPPAQGGGIALSPEEERIIHKLIADAGLLSARGVETLHIQKSGSFLQSLADAIAAALRGS